MSITLACDEAGQSPLDADHILIATLMASASPVRLRRRIALTKPGVMRRRRWMGRPRLSSPSEPPGFDDGDRERVVYVVVKVSVRLRRQGDSDVRNALPLFLKPWLRRRFGRIAGILGALPWRRRCEG
jgi:hypothetical protein